jgi:hypothetical protein
MDTIIGRSLALLNSARTLGSVRRRDDNSLLKVQNVCGDSSAFFRGSGPAEFSHTTALASAGCVGRCEESSTAMERFA